MIWMPEYKAWDVVPRPQREERLAGYFVFPHKITVAFAGLSAGEEDRLWRFLDRELKDKLKKNLVRGQNEKAVITVKLETPETRLLPREGYVLQVEKNRIKIKAEDFAGLFYGLTTLLQLAAYGKLEEPVGAIPCRHILDYPHFPHRSVMLDLGRALFSLEFLKRLVQVFSSLKYNALCLHLNDNELNAVRYPGTSLGSENPFALKLEDYAELIRYASEYCMEIIPQIESWGHAGSILRHYPHLYGASRAQGNGHSFGIGRQTFKLLEMLYDHWTGILPDGAKFHVGLDEANWVLLKGASAKTYNHDTLVRHIYNLIHKRAASHKKNIRMMMFGEPKLGTKVPPDLREQIILEPWWYQAHRDKIPELLNTVKTDGLAQKAPFICGAGMSGIHEHGALVATEQWARLALSLPNCLGLNVMLWGSNDVQGRFIGIFGGSHLSWNPCGWQALETSAAGYEFRLSQLVTRMRTWQELACAANADELRKACGPEVLHGRYRAGRQTGEQVAPVWRPRKIRF